MLARKALNVLQNDPRSQQLNIAMQSKSDIAYFVDLAQRAGIKYREDPPKNWDNVKAVAHVLKHHPERGGIILDAGGTMSGAFLQSLEKFGYTRLVALDLTGPDPPINVGRIVHRRGDITGTDYPDNYFDAVACLSVVEHGVDMDKFFAEMARVTKAGGSLIVSMDYWAQKINNPDGRSAYGVPVFIFGKEEILQAITTAEKHGWEITSQVNTKCAERTVKWMGFEYTFMVLGFTQKS